MADTLHLQQSLRLWILCLTEFLDLPIILLDLRGHLCDLLKHRAKRLPESRRHRRHAALRKARSSRSWYTVTASLRQSANRVDRCCTEPDQESACTYQCQGLLLL